MRAHQDLTKVELSFDRVLDAVQEFIKTLSPREKRVLQIGLRASHIEEALAHGEIDRARGHFHELIKAAKGLENGRWQLEGPWQEEAIIARPPPFNLKSNPISPPMKRCRLKSMAARGVFVVALGDDGLPLGYLLHRKSAQTLEDFVRAQRQRLEMQAERAGLMVNVTRGPLVRMNVEDLRQQIPGFDAYVDPCLNEGGIVVAIKRADQWTFNCMLLPKLPRGFRQRLPSPERVRQGLYEGAA